MSATATLKQRIRNKEVIVALRADVSLSRQKIETALSKGTYDLLYIDGQHSAFSEEQIVSYCSAAEEMDLPVQFRIPHTRNAYLIGRYLDFGLTGILVPETETVATVDEAIFYTYYPPLGRRSWGGPARRGIKARGGRLDRREYAEWWNSFVVLSVQLESIAAINNARSFVKPGMDYLAFGPNDLQFDLEMHPEFPMQGVDECMRYVAAQVKDLGTPLGMAVPTLPEEREKYIEMGITIFQENIRP